MVEVITCGDFEVWFASLPNVDRVSVAVVIDLLEEFGLALGSPHSSDVRGAKLPLRELRPKRGSCPFRVFYAFDTKRRAVLLTGDDKRRMEKKKPYAKIISRCERYWKHHTTVCD